MIDKVLKWWNYKPKNDWDEMRLHYQGCLIALIGFLVFWLIYGYLQ